MKVQQKDMTDPYVIPAMVHFLKCMTLQVRVPVLSEKRYFTWKKKQTISNESFNRRVLIERACNDNF